MVAVTTTLLVLSSLVVKTYALQCYECAESTTHCGKDETNTTCKEGEKFCVSIENNGTMSAKTCMSQAGLEGLNASANACVGEPAVKRVCSCQTDLCNNIGHEETTPITGETSTSSPITGQSTSSPITGQSTSTPVTGQSTTTPVSGQSISTSTPITGSTSTPVSGQPTSAPKPGQSTPAPKPGQSTSTLIPGKTSTPGEPYPDDYYDDFSSHNFISGTVLFCCVLQAIVFGH